MQFIYIKFSVVFTHPIYSVSHANYTINIVYTIKFDIASKLPIYFIVSKVQCTKDCIEQIDHFTMILAADNVEFIDIVCLCFQGRDISFQCCFHIPNINLLYCQLCYKILTQKHCCERYYQI